MRVILILALLLATARSISKEIRGGHPDFGGDPPDNFRDDLIIFWRLLSEDQPNR
jgi:hypothetical protein